MLPAPTSEGTAKTSSGTIRERQCIDPQVNREREKQNKINDKQQANTDTSISGPSCVQVTIASVDAAHHQGFKERGLGTHHPCAHFVYSFIHRQMTNREMRKTEKKRKKNLYIDKQTDGWKKKRKEK